MRAIVVLAAVFLLLTPAPALAQEEQTDRCEPRKAGEQCGEGQGRQARGGGEKVSHKGWPKINGILWQVRDTGDHERTGTEDNGELLGHHGDEKLNGGPGKDVLWGDWDPKNNTTKQSDVL